MDILEKLEPIKQKVNEGIDRLSKFSTAVKEIRKLEEVAQTFNHYKKISEINVDDLYEFHKSGFALE